LNCETKTKKKVHLEHSSLVVFGKQTHQIIIVLRTQTETSKTHTWETAITTLVNCRADHRIHSVSTAAANKQTTAWTRFWGHDQKETTSMSGRINKQRLWHERRRQYKHRWMQTVVTSLIIHQKTRVRSISDSRWNNDQTQLWWGKKHILLLVLSGMQ
jgi:hypothetical protein